MKKLIIILIVLVCGYFIANYSLDGKPNKILKEYTIGYSDDDKFLVNGINSTPSNLNTSFVISNFASVLNAALKSSKKKPLWYRKGHSDKVWSRGNSKLNSVKNNTITFETEVYYRRNVLGFSVTDHYWAVVNANLVYNNKTNSFDIKYKISNIRGIPGEVEQWININRERTTSITVPLNVSKYKDPNKKIAFTLSSPASNQLKIDLKIPLNSNELSVFSK